MAGERLDPFSSWNNNEGQIINPAPRVEVVKKSELDIPTIGNTVIDALATVIMEQDAGATLVGSTFEDNQFTCDFDFTDGKTISSNRLPELTKTVAKTIKASSFSAATITTDEALMLAKSEIHRDAILSSSKDDQVDIHVVNDQILVPRKGDFSENTPKLSEDNYFLAGVSGVYWQGKETNPMIQRVKGVVFQNKEQKKAYLEAQAEAEKRDHVRLGKELKLFMFEETAPGEPYWLPRGLTIYNELIKFWREKHEERGYEEIASPLISKASLYETSGHMEHYRDDIFIADTHEGPYVLKPMNCPNAMLVYKNESQSYRNLPLRYSDTDRLHRFERAGEIHGLLRARAFQQDDAHIFVSEDQIAQEFESIFEIADEFYSIFGLEHSFRLSTRGEDFMGDSEVWDMAEDTLRNILEGQKLKRNKDYRVSEGDAAFYGPKIDIMMKDALKRNWQMGTIQLDFQLPQRFDLKYTGKDGQLHTPVVIHNVIYGSLERFIGIITENFGGAFPTWISPEQAVLVPVTEKNDAYARYVADILKSNGVRVKNSNDFERKMGKRIYDAKNQKVPYVLVLGDKEETENNVAVNVRPADVNSQIPPFEMSLANFSNELVNEIKNKSIKPGMHP